MISAPVWRPLRRSEECLDLCAFAASEASVMHESSLAAGVSAAVSGVFSNSSARGTASLEGSLISLPSVKGLAAKRPIVKNIHAPHRVDSGQPRYILRAKQIARLKECLRKDFERAQPRKPLESQSQKI